MSVRYEYVVPDYFVVSVKKQSCVFDSWLGGILIIVSVLLELVWLNRGFAVPDSD